MSVQKKLTFNGEYVTLTTTYDPTEVFKRNYEIRMRDLNKGMAKNLRYVCDIPEESLEHLCAVNDLDAIAFKYSNDDAIRRPALRRLLVRFPGWLTSEGRI